MKDPVKTIRGLVAKIKLALTTNRDDAETITELKDQSARDSKDLRAQLEEAGRDEAEILALETELEEVLALAIAATPGTEPVQAGKTVGRSPSQIIKEGEAPNPSKIPDSRSLVQPGDKTEEQLKETEEARVKREAEERGEKPKEEDEEK